MSLTPQQVIDEAHADWHSEHQTMPFGAMVLDRLAGHGFQIGTYSTTQTLEQNSWPGQER